MIYLNNIVFKMFLSSRNDYFVFHKFITSSQINEILLECPPLDEWFPFITKNVSRLQCRHVTLKTDPTIFSILNQCLSNIGLKLKDNMIHPRLYKQNDWMDWHVDYDHLPFNESDEFEYECILVLQNTSDSVTKFKKEESKEEEYASKDGDLLIVCRHGISHCVTPITTGERYTLKFTAIKN